MNETHEVGDARAEVESEMRGRLDSLSLLHRIAEGQGSTLSNDELLSVDVGYGVPGPLSDEQMVEEAEARLYEYPLAVEQTVSFEVVLSTGGPDDRLIFECDRVALSRPGATVPIQDGYEIRRVLYRYSWTGSAEVELTGEDREVAEAFARRVVPELVE